MDFLSNFYTHNLTLVQATLMSMVLAASLQVALRAGVFSLASVGYWGVGAYAAGILARDAGTGPVVAIVAALAICGLTAYPLARLLVRLRGLYMAMATVAFDLVVIVIALNLKSLTGGPLGLPGVPVLLSTWQLTLIVAAVALLLSQLERGAVGRWISVASHDEELAAGLGIDVRRLHARVFVLSAVLGGLAGSLNALLFNNVSTDQFGFGLIVLALTMAVVGGMGSWVGSYVGAVVVLWLPEVLRFLSTWRNLVFGVLLIIVISRMPEGLLGSLRTMTRAPVRLAHRNQP